MIVDIELKKWASPAQVELIDKVNELGSFRAAGRHLGLPHDSARQLISRLRARAEVQGYAPEADMTHVAPSAFQVKGTSTLYGPDGVQKLQWVKTKLNSNVAEQIIRDFITDLAQGARGQSPAVSTPSHTNADLVAIYPMGDPHFGLYSWIKETGADFDLKIAEQLTCAAVDHLIAATPPAETAILLNLGDFFHADSSTNATPHSGNPLDVDGRYGQIMQIGLRAMVYCIQRLAEKHKTVHAWMMPGNHDPHSSFALALALDAYFSNNERVHVDLSTSLFKYLKFGDVLVGAHHGHATKTGDLPLLMATDRAEDWGNTKHRYFYVGHIHHKTMKEHPGVVVESFNTLAAGDAWHHGQGYRARRNMHSICLHRTYGEFSRQIFDASMLQAA